MKKQRIGTSRRALLLFLLTNLLWAVILYGMFWWFTDALRTGRYLQRVYVAEPVTQSDVVALGDSLTEGLGATNSRGFVTLLSERLGIPIINLGIRRERSYEIADRVTEALSYKPKIVLLTAGGNDLLRGLTFDQTLVHLDTIFTRFADAGVRVIYLGVRTGIWEDEYQSELADFVTQYPNVIFVPNILDGITFNPEYLFDPVHPNDAGHAIIADRIEPILHQELFVIQ